MKVELLNIKRFDVLSVKPKDGESGDPEYLEVGYITQGDDGELNLGVMVAGKKGGTLYESRVVVVGGRITREYTDSYELHVEAEIDPGIDVKVWRRRPEDGQYVQEPQAHVLAKATLPPDQEFYRVSASIGLDFAI